MEDDRYLEAKTPIEYSILEVGLREGIGRMMAGMVLGKKDSGEQIQFPEEIPELHKAQSYLSTYDEKVPEFGKRILRKVSKAGSAAEELIPDALRLLELTDEIYHTHREVIYELREQYSRPIEMVDPGEPEEESPKLLDLVKEMIRTRKQKDKKDSEEPEKRLQKDITVEIGDCYFDELTSRLGEETLLEYVDISFKGLRVAYQILQLQPEDLSRIERYLLSKGEPMLREFAQEKIDELLYVYTSDSDLVASVAQTLWGLMEIPDEELVEEKLTWIEDGFRYMISSLYK